MIDTTGPQKPPSCNTAHRGSVVNGIGTAAPIKTRLGPGVLCTYVARTLPHDLLAQVRIEQKACLAAISSFLRWYWNMATKTTQLQHGAQRQCSAWNRDRSTHERKARSGGPMQHTVIHACPHSHAQARLQHASVDLYPSPAIQIHQELMNCGSLTQ